MANDLRPASNSRDCRGFAHGRGCHAGVWRGIESRSRAVPAPLSTRAALSATERIASGLFKKYVLAQGLRGLFLTEFHAQGAYLLFEAQINFIWLYLDFSAYSDLALGRLWHGVSWV